MSGHLAVVEFLIENGADIHGRKTAECPPIVAAAFSNSPAIIDLFLKKGVSVNARGSFGATACHWTTRFGKIESTRFLIDAGCDLELRDDNGNTVLLACMPDSVFWDVNVINSLLERGADACAKDKEGKTPRNIIEYRSARGEQSAKQVLKILRQAEQRSSTTATNDPQESEPTSSGQTVSHTSTS